MSQVLKGLTLNTRPCELLGTVKMAGLGTSLAVQWLILHASNAGGMGFDPWLGN